MFWSCVNCTRYVKLDCHGRCEHCGSDAVIPADPAVAAELTRPWQYTASRRVLPENRTTGLLARLFAWAG